jgi:hypothetical protein
VFGLWRSNRLWSDVPILENIEPRVLIGILTSWSLFELFGSKKLSGQRVLQNIQLFLSPVVGAILAITVVKISPWPTTPLWFIGLIGAILALVLKLVEVGWFFRLRGLPIWVVILEDLLCIFLVFFAFKAPKEGGIIVMLLLWLTIRSANYWRDWYLNTKRPPLPPSDLQ